MPKVSVVIPTHNRPELLKKAVHSVLAQTYQDFEIIVIDDGTEERADKIVASFKDKRIKYIQHREEKGGSAARNTGIKNSRGEYIAFLDDDDEWLLRKLEIQMKKFVNTSQDIGFCFSAVKYIYDDRKKVTEVPDGIADYFELVLKRFKGFLTSTLIIKKNVFNEVEIFDKKFPSHQEVDLMIRVSKKYKGLGINRPFVKMNTSKEHTQIGSSLKNRIKGAVLILNKHFEEYKGRPEILSKHYFRLALFYRDDKQYKQAEKMLKMAWKVNFRFLYFFHYLSLVFNGKLYKLFRK